MELRATTRAKFMKSGPRLMTERWGPEKKKPRGKWSEENVLGRKFPHLIKEWHPKKNGDLTPFDIQYGSAKKVWWKCQAQGHEWQARVSGRSAGSHCPQCPRRRPSPRQSFAARCPDIRKEWHPTKNGDLKPDQVFPHSKQRVWWICRFGHEWQAMIAYRKRGRGCHFCGRLLQKPGQSLHERRTDLLKEWHPTRNFPLTPHHVGYKSHRQVWWRCENGHEWKTMVILRNRGRGCPYCAGTKAGAGSSLAARFPHLAKSWHPDRNSPLTADDVVPGSAKTVWWRCEEGHEWEGAVRDRIRRKGCPFCTGVRATKEYSFAGLFPKQAREWHHEKNGELTPHDLLPSSNRKVWWKCAKDHEWQVAANERHVHGCPYCSGRRITPEKSLAHHHPALAEQWHPEKNGGRTPLDTSAVSQKKHWWICLDGHVWLATVRRRLRDDRCPSCGRRPEPAIPVQRAATIDDAPLEPIQERRFEVETKKIEGTLTCLICGVQFPSLTWHLKLAHRMSGNAYREQFNLPQDMPLTLITREQ